ncbi:F-box/kelch-repeat protein At1g67480-like [Rhodamnia argentea]|uniref:F-box/kelch-repeat protein At1g67480-like n=1 Tax=Rhodamnia argentea TaxID=178133 RepID=A0A8B8Q673_9MYRT|nr:F-box/kelch-repeat protein At1g67480-like [Rhodamnia argentea]
MCSSTLVRPRKMALPSRTGPDSSSKLLDEFDSPIIPGLPDDVAKTCLALVPRREFPSMGLVCKRWRSFLGSKEFLLERKLGGTLEEWVFILTTGAGKKESHWEATDGLGNKQWRLPPMPGPLKSGFGVAVVDGKLLIVGGYAVTGGSGAVSAEVYQYDSCLNSWSKLRNMNEARCSFACAEVNGMVYAVGGYGADGNIIGSAEAYDPNTGKWTLIESLRLPRWGCFACGFEGKLYVMGGRSSFTIGSARSVCIYDPEKRAWCELKHGCVMVTTHAMLGTRLFCMEWTTQKKLSVFDLGKNSWDTVSLPPHRSSEAGFRLGTLDGRLLLFAAMEVAGYHTLSYDPNAAPGSEWQASKINLSGSCLYSVTIKA